MVTAVHYLGECVSKCGLFVRAGVFVGDFNVTALVVSVENPREGVARLVGVTSVRACAQRLRRRIARLASHVSSVLHLLKTVWKNDADIFWLWKKIIDARRNPHLSDGNSSLWI